MPVPEWAEVAAPAKVNLSLRILAREESGYHTLETLFCALSLADTVRVRRGAPGVRLRVEGGVDTGPTERNLCVRAAEAFHATLGEAPAVDIDLTKRIPSAAGLGGGSSDGAATLRVLNALHGDPFGGPALLQMAIELGSDVPFFLSGSVLALAWSRGERLLMLPPLQPRPVLVAHPGTAMPTAEAFARVAERRGRGYRPEALSFPVYRLHDWRSIAAGSRNDFEEVVIERIPAVGQAMEAMRGAGASLTRMAGSGSSVFGVFASDDARDAAMERVRALGMECWAAQTLEREPEVRVEG